MNKQFLIYLFFILIILICSLFVFLYLAFPNEKSQNVSFFNSDLNTKIYFNNVTIKEAIYYKPNYNDELIMFSIIPPKLSKDILGLKLNTKNTFQIIDANTIILYEQKIKGQDLSVIYNYLNSQKKSTSFNFIVPKTFYEKLSLDQRSEFLKTLNNYLLLDLNFDETLIRQKNLARDLETFFEHNNLLLNQSYIKEYILFDYPGVDTKTFNEWNKLFLENSASKKEFKNKLESNSKPTIINLYSDNIVQNKNNVLIFNSNKDLSDLCVKLYLKKDFIYDISCGVNLVKDINSQIYWLPKESGKYILKISNEKEVFYSKEIIIEKDIVINNPKDRKELLNKYSWPNNIVVGLTHKNPKITIEKPLVNPNLKNFNTKDVIDSILPEYKINNNDNVSDNEYIKIEILDLEGDQSEFGKQPYILRITLDYTNYFNSGKELFVSVDKNIQLDYGVFYGGLAPNINLIVNLLEPGLIVYTNPDLDLLIKDYAFTKGWDYLLVNKIPELDIESQEFQIINDRKVLNLKSKNNLDYNIAPDIPYTGINVNYIRDSKIFEASFGLLTELTIPELNLRLFVMPDNILKVSIEHFKNMNFVKSKLIELRQKIKNYYYKDKFNYLLIVADDDEIPILDTYGLIPLNDTGKVHNQILDNVFYGNMNDDAFVELNVGRLPSSNYDYLMTYFSQNTTYYKPRDFRFSSLYFEDNRTRKAFDFELDFKSRFAFTTTWPHLFLDLESESEITEALANSEFLEINAHGLDVGFMTPYSVKSEIFDLKNSISYDKQKLTLDEYLKKKELYDDFEKAYLDLLLYTIEDFPQINKKPIIIGNSCFLARNYGKKLLLKNVNNFVGSYDPSTEYVFLNPNTSNQKKITVGRLFTDYVNAVYLSKEHSIELILYGDPTNLIYPNIISENVVYEFVDNKLILKYPATKLNNLLSSLDNEQIELFKYKDVEKINYGAYNLSCPFVEPTDLIPVDVTQFDDVALVTKIKVDDKNYYLANACSDTDIHFFLSITPENIFIGAKNTLFTNFYSDNLNYSQLNSFLKSKPKIYVRSQKPNSELMPIDFVIFKDNKINLHLSYYEWFNLVIQGFEEYGFEFVFINE
jgi:hypothetical protein